MILEYNRKRVLNSGSGPDLTSGLISCWEFNETTGTTANDAHGANDGTITGATINQTGKIDRCYSYDGSGDWVNYGDVIDLERTDSFTISSWVQIDTLSTNKAILSKMESGNNFRGYLLRINTKDRPTVTLRNDNSPSNFVDIEFNDALIIGTWYHIIITYDGSSDSSGIKCYLDNLELAPAGILGDTLSATILNNEPLNVGTLNDGAFYDFDGLIDQTAVWNRILTTAERSELYNTGSGLAYSSW